MFARVGRSAFICLKCQLRLTRQHNRDLPRRPQPAFARSVQRRWQSAAAVQLEDDDGFEDGSGQTIHPPAAAALPQERQKARPPERQKHSSSRTFTPSKSLGVARLGEPADVLILPSRDRKIPEVPEDEGEKPKAKLHELLNSGKEPLTLEQLQNNIEHIKSQAMQAGGFLEKDVWKRMRGSLAKGFTRRQLYAYIQLCKSGAVGALSHKHLSSGSLAESILSKIWGFTIQKHIQAVPKQERLEEQSEQSTKLVVSEQGLAACLADADRPFDRLSERFNVKIDVFQETREIVIRGRNLGVPSRDIRNLCKQVKETSFQLGENIRAIFAQSGGMALLERLRLKFGLPISYNPRSQSLDVIYLEPSAYRADLLRRELLLESESVCSYQNVFSFPRLKGVRKVPAMAHFTETLPFVDSNLEWRRLVFKDPAQVPEIRLSQLTRAQKINVEVTTRELFKSLEEAPLDRYNPGMKSEVFASFGHVLRDTYKDQAASASSATTQRAYGSRSVFVTDLPLLPQLLAHSAPWESDNSKKLDNTRAVPFIGSCVLEPMSTDHQAPTIAIVLAGQDPLAGFNQPLQVRRVSLRSSEITRSLALPGEASDVLFTRRFILDIFDSNQSKAKFKSLLQQIGTFLAQANPPSAGSTTPSFPPFYQFSIPIQRISEPQPAATGPSETSKEQKRNLVKGHSECMYMLKSMDMLDVTTYRSFHDRNVPLEHIVRSAADQSYDRQDLILGTSILPSADSSKSSTSKESKSSSALLATALDMAVRIGDKKLLRSGVGVDHDLRRRDGQGIEEEGRKIMHHKVHHKENMVAPG